MSHHHHHHSPIVESSFSLGKAFFFAIVLNVLFVVAEFATGFIYNSIGLISDAAHNLGDVASLLLSASVKRQRHSGQFAT